MKPSLSQLGTIAAAAAVALLLASCGRRGPLEPPPSAATPTNAPLTGTPGEPGPAGQSTANSGTAAPAQAGATQTPPYTPRHFFLDPLL